MLQIYYFFLLFLFYETEKNVFEIYNSVSVKKRFYFYGRI